MPYIVTNGIVLRETETKDADKILTLLTAERGKISVIARGVRRRRCKYAAWRPVSGLVGMEPYPKGRVVLRQ